MQNISANMNNNNSNNNNNVIQTQNFLPKELMRKYELIIIPGPGAKQHKINVKVLKFNKAMGEKIFGKNEIIHKIDLIEYTLLNEGDSISEFKQFGFGIYVFFFIFNKSFNNIWIVANFWFLLYVLYFF